MNKKIKLIILSIIIIIIILVIATLSISYFRADQVEIEIQEKQEQLYLNEYNNQDYTIQDPYVVVNPYSINPLSAYVGFSSEKPVKYSYTVQGTTDSADFSYKTDDYTKGDIFIPVVMLYSGSNTVAIEVEDEDGQKTNSEIEIETDTNVKSENVNIEYTDGYEDILDNSFIIDEMFNVYDLNSDIRMTLDILDQGRQTVKIQNNGIFAVDNDVRTGYHMSLIGKIETVYHAPSTYQNFHHDLTMDTDGNLYALGGGNKEGTIREQQIYKYNDNGRLVDVWDYEKEFDENKVNNSRTDRNTDVDPIHLNSIDYNEKDDTLIVSSQAQSIVMVVDAHNGDIQYLMADDQILVENKDKKLTQVGDDFVQSSGQHTVFIDDNPYFDQYRNEDTYVISMFNNNFCMQEDGTLPTKERDPSDTENEILEDTDIHENLYDQSVCEVSQSTVEWYAINSKEMTVESINSFDIDSYSNVLSSVFPYENDYYSVSSGSNIPAQTFIYDIDGNKLVEIIISDEEDIYTDDGSRYRTRIVTNDVLAEAV